MEKKVKILLGISIPVALLVLAVMVMAVFRLCPPIKSGPQPPWCTNPERFERDVEVIPGFFHSLKYKLFNSREQLPESIYAIKELSYISGNFEKTEYDILLGIGSMDNWGVICNNSGNCDDNTRGVISTMSRAQSIGSDFVSITDFRVIANAKFDIGEYGGGAGTMNKKEADNIISTAKKYGQKVFYLVNLYDGTRIRMDDRFHEVIMDPSQEIINKLFDEWGRHILNEAEKVFDADYFVVSPGDKLFQFEGFYELQNNRYNRIIEKARQAYNGKICVGGNLGYLSQPEINFYENADCIIIWDDIDDMLPKETLENIESIEKGWDKYFEHEIFKNQEKELFLSVMMFSYDGAIQEGWYETFDYEGERYAQDWKEQALVYEGLFMSVYKNEPEITGIISYGYWWTDDMYPETWITNNLIHSIRGKDAEHVFYKWSKII